MLICEGYNEMDFYAQVEKGRLNESLSFKKLKRIAIVLGMIGIIALIVSSITAGVTSTMTLYLGSMLVAVFTIIPTLFISILLFKFHHGEKWYREQKRLSDGIKVYVESDLSIIVKYKDEWEAKIFQVKSFHHEESTHSLSIEGKIQCRRGEDSIYLISLSLVNRRILESFLTLNMNQKSYQKYHNDTLKKIMHMKNEQRNYLFLNEIKECYFLLACSFDKGTGNRISFQNDIVLYAASKQQKTLVFTSLEELDEELRKQYPILLVSSLSQIIGYSEEDKSHVFMDQQLSDIEGIIINKNQEQIVLERRPLTELLDA